MLGKEVLRYSRHLKGGISFLIEYYTTLVTVFEVILKRLFVLMTVSFLAKCLQFTVWKNVLDVVKMRNCYGCHHIT